MCEGTRQEAQENQNPNPNPNANPNLKLQLTCSTNDHPYSPSPSSSASSMVDVEEDDNNKSSNNHSCCVCELCGSEASLYCQADDAYLCRRCDGWVHGANFLANRHVRCILCDTCHRFSQRYLVGSSREVELPAVVGGKRSRRSHCYGVGQDCCSSERMLKRPFLFL